MNYRYIICSVWFSECPVQVQAFSIIDIMLYLQSTWAPPCFHCLVCWKPGCPLICIFASLFGGFHLLCMCLYNVQAHAQQMCIVPAGSESGQTLLCYRDPWLPVWGHLPAAGVRQAAPDWLPPVCTLTVTCQSFHWWEGQCSFLQAFLTTYIWCLSLCCF